MLDQIQAHLLNLRIQATRKIGDLSPSAARGFFVVVRRKSFLCAASELIYFF